MSKREPAMTAEQPQHAGRAASASTASSTSSSSEEAAPSTGKQLPSMVSAIGMMKDRATLAKNQLTPQLQTMKERTSKRLEKYQPSIDKVKSSATAAANMGRERMQPALNRVKEGSTQGWSMLKTKLASAAPVAEKFQTMGMHVVSDILGDTAVEVTFVEDVVEAHARFLLELRSHASPKGPRVLLTRSRSGTVSSRHNSTAAPPSAAAQCFSTPFLLGTVLLFCGSVQDLGRMSGVNSACRSFIQSERRLWRFCVRHGDVPSSIRFNFWEHTAGVRRVRETSELDFETYLQMARSKGECTELILTDVRRTYGRVAPHKRTTKDNKEIVLDTEQELINQLSDILHALAGRFPDVGYCQGMDYIAAHVLDHVKKSTEAREAARLEQRASDPTAPSSPPVSPTRTSSQAATRVEVERAFWLLVALFEQYGLRQMFCPGLQRLQLHCYQCQRLFELASPALAQHFDDEKIMIDMFVVGWFQTLFLYLNVLPRETLDRIWDIFLFENNWKIQLRVALALMQLAEPFIAGRHIDEIMQFLNTFASKSDELLAPAALLRRSLQIKVTNAMLLKLARQHSRRKKSKMNVVKGEIHNVLSMMRVNARWASAERFRQEIPAATQSPLMRAFKQLHYELQSVTDLSDVDTVTYLLPFVMVIESEKTSGFITGAAISSLNKLLLYGLIHSDSLRADVAINRLAVCVSRCRFEETHRADDEGVLMKLLELVESSLRSDAGPLISDENVWHMMQLCYSLSCQPRSSLHLCRAAENTLAHVILIVFGRMPELAAADDDADEPPEPARARGRANGYGVALLEQTLQFLARLIAPASNDDATCVLGLRLINIVLETAGPSLGQHAGLVSVLQGDLCKFLLQNSETEELAVLSLTLRVVFNLFNSIKDHLKVQLEVFFTSVHLRLIDSPSCSAEQKELALESLLEFCREPAMMLDLYVNYDCDVHCTNLFEVLCKSLARNCQALESPGGSLNALTLLCLEGLLAVIESIARRCPLQRGAADKTPPDVRALNGADLARFTAGRDPQQQQRGPPSDISLDDVSPLSSVRDLMQLVMAAGSSDDDDGGSSSTTSSDDPRDVSGSQLAWLHTARERTAEVLQQRKRTKKRLALAAEKFNTDRKHWVSYAQEMELLPEELTPEAVAAFLLHTPGLNKTLVGDYLGEGPPDKYPFHAAVRDAYVASLDFGDAASLDEALRRFLARFRLPGEAQKIDRLMEAFAKQFYAQCASSGPLADADAAYVLAFSIIMLNTDLHSDQIAKKMTLDEFVRNNRGINAGQDLPAEYLAEVYGNIRDREIQMQHDVSDLAEPSFSTVDRYSTQWEGVLKRSENVVGASFTSNASILKLRAGLYEKDMFQLIAEPTLKCVLLAFEKTCDVTNMERALEGLSNCATIALYYDLGDYFNRIMAALSTYFLTFAHGVLSGEKVYLPPRTGGVRATSRATAAAISSPSASLPGGGDDDDDDDDADADADTVASPRAATEAAATTTATASGSTPSTHALGQDHVRGAKTRRALLSLKLLFQFIQQRHEAFRGKAWSSVVECVLMFNELDVVPTSLVEMDDFVDSRGVPLPPIQGSPAPASPSGASASASSASSSAPSTPSAVNGVSGKTRERSRRVAERQAAIRSRMKSMSSGNSQHAGYGTSGHGSTGGGGSGGGGSGSLWGSLSSYLWADDERVDESFSLVTKMLREEVAVLGGGLLEKENWLRMVRKLHEPSLTGLLETLLTCRDPFKGVLRPSSDSGVDAMMQENAILVLELSVDLILVNAHRIVALQLWAPFHQYAAKILSTPLRELHMPGLVERVVVHILRVSIRLFHDEKIRPQLMATLQLLLDALDDEMYRALSDRLAIGVSMLLKANLVYMHDFHDWDVLMGVLENVVQHKNGRAACWDSVKLLAEGGHLNDENVTLWIATCLRFVSHRTPYSVDALRLLQGLAARDSAYRMDDRAWLEVMRVMLSYLHDDRAAIAKTAWECLYNSLLLPGVSVTKDTWRLCFDDVIFTFDDQVSEGVWSHTRDASLYSVTLLSKTFLHNLSVLVELSNFDALWLSVVRRLATKLVVGRAHQSTSSAQMVVFETTLQSLYNLLLIVQAEELLDRVISTGDAAGSTTTTLRDATCAIVDELIPEFKDQLGLVPPPAPAPAPEPVPAPAPEPAQAPEPVPVPEEPQVIVIEDRPAQEQEDSTQADEQVLMQHSEADAAEPPAQAQPPPGTRSGRSSPGIASMILEEEVTEAV
ncbi:hypothetical protein ATCC90586_010863 [Pythium insidiosum]|nr:hypothetical protein ATCC90586_010863 [Pythium insidiosum]